MPDATVRFPHPTRAVLGPLPQAAQGALKTAAAVPGVRVLEEHVQGLTEAFVELPYNLWHLAPVRSLFELSGIQPIERKLVDVSVSSPLLHDYQRIGVDFMASRQYVINCDALGAGKTRQAAIAADLVRGRADRPVLICAPKYLRSSWRAELEKIGAITEPEREWCALEGRTATMDLWVKGARWIFCHYEIIEAWWSFLDIVKPAAVILDEAHFLKNSRARRAKGAALASSVTPNRFLLTGTPILNRVGEFWNLLSLCTGKWSWGTPIEFRRRYAGAYHDGYAWRDRNATNTAELKSRIETCYIRRTVDQLGLNLPPLTRRVIEVDLTAAAAKKYADLFEGVDFREVIRAILEGRASRKSFEFLHKSRQITSKIKVPATAELMQSAADQGESAVVFAHTRAIVEQLARRLDPPAAYVHGGQPQHVRDEIVHDFRRQHGEVLVATFGALGTGVNLQNARVVVMHDLMETPATMLQAEGRVYRQGQLNAVQSLWVVCKGTLDAFLAKHIVQKAEVIADATGDYEPATLADTLATVAEDEVESMADRLTARWRTR